MAFNKRDETPSNVAVTCTVGQVRFPQRFSEPFQVNVGIAKSGHDTETGTIDGPNAGALSHLLGLFIGCKDLLDDAVFIEERAGGRPFGQGFNPGGTNKGGGFRGTG